LREQVNNLKKETEQTPTLTQFQELSEIALSDEELDFEKLKEEIKRLKLKDLNPYYEEKKKKFEELVNEAKSKVGQDLTPILELFLKTNKQILEHGKKNSENDFYQGSLKGKLETCQTLLQSKLSAEDLQDILDNQSKFFKSERKIESLKSEEKYQSEIIQNPPSYYKS
jgi:predicted DNA-binding protein (UPF0251 family)